MKPRATPLIVPANSRYWTVDLPNKGVHTFRHPQYGVGAAAVQALAAYRRANPLPEGTERTYRVEAADLVVPAGLILGVCWYHPLHALETPLPKKHTPEEMLAFADAVVDELQEAGYNLLDLIELFGGVMPEMQKRQDIVAMADARATFSEPQRGISTVC